MIMIDVERQTLVHNNRIYPISTAKNGTGSEADSFKTPLGRHVVSEIIGLEKPIYTQFMARVPMGVFPPSQWSLAPKKDCILTRIIRLKGDEPGINQGPGIDSYDRFIYIHGTHEEHLIGTPQSKGCIRMRNHDIITLCRNIHSGDIIDIKERL